MSPVRRITNADPQEAVKNLERLGVDYTVLENGDVLVSIEQFPE